MATDLFRLDGRIALVTGATRGLGAAMAEALAAAGADVVLHGSRSAATATASRVTALGRRAWTITADLEDASAPARLAADALAAAGRVDILVNNAGTIRRAPAADYPDADWDAVHLQVNLSSVFRLSRELARPMLERGDGKIVNIASLLSFQGGIRVPAYTAAKAGVAHLTQALANEWAGRGVNVNAIAPGYMLTDNTKALAEDPVRSAQIGDRIPAGRWGRPEDLGGAVVFLASRAADYVHGHTLVVDGGWMGR